MNHINPKVVLGLGAAAALASIAAMVASSGRQPVDESAQPAAYALPALRGRINDVRAVTLTAAEDKPAVTLVRESKGWTVQEKGGYPADTGKLRELLLQLADASLLEPKTGSEQRYAELGVEDVKARDAKGIRVSLEEGSGKPEQLIVGNLSPQGKGTFVRRPEDRQSWLAKGSLSIERDPARWLDTALADIPAARIAEIVLTRPDGKTVRLFKTQPGDAAYKVDGLPAGREPAADSVL
jgi:hypothetical protein